MNAKQIAGDFADRVRDLIAEAESHASEIVDRAEAEAKEIRASAEAEAKEIRARGEAAAGARAEQLRNALAALDISGSGGPSAEMPQPPDPAPEPSPPATPEPTPPTDPEPLPPNPEIEPPGVPHPDPTPPSEPTPGEPVPPSEPQPPSQPDPAPQPQIRANGVSPALANGDAANGSRSTDSTAARIVAVKLALGGASAREIKAALDADYELDDSGSVVEAALAKVKK